MARRRGGDRPSASARPAPVTSNLGPASVGTPLVRRVATIAIVVLAAVVATVAVRELRHRADAGSLPAVAAAMTLSPAIREHVTSKYAAALDDPRSAAAVGALCVAYHADLLFDQAQRCYDVVVRLAPPEWRWAYFQALLESERGSGQALTATLQQVVARAPDYGPAWLRLGEVEFKAGHYDRAEEAWNRATSTSEPSRPTSDGPLHKVDVPASAYASLGLARIALARGDPDRARQILERVTGQSPRFGSAFRLLAESYTALGMSAEAGRAMQRANRLPPYAPYLDPQAEELVRESRSSTFLLRQASDADLSSNAEWSEFLTRRALSFDPENPEVVAKLGRLLRTLGRSGEALEFLGRYTQMVPTDFQGIGQLGSCLSDLGRFDEAEPLIRRALAGLDDALSHYNLGALLSATGRFDDAVVEYRRALDRDPTDVDARSNLAAVLLRQGKIAQAQQELVRVLQIEPEHANAHTNFGVLLARQGQMGRATQEFETALRINPQQRQAAEALRELKK